MPRVEEVLCVQGGRPGELLRICSSLEVVVAERKSVFHKERREIDARKLAVPVLLHVGVLARGGL